MGSAVTAVTDTGTVGGASALAPDQASFGNHMVAASPECGPHACGYRHIALHCRMPPSSRGPFVPPSEILPQLMGNLAGLDGTTPAAIAIAARAMRVCYAALENARGVLPRHPLPAA